MSEPAVSRIANVVGATFADLPRMIGGKKALKTGFENLQKFALQLKGVGPRFLKGLRTSDDVLTAEDRNTYSAKPKLAPDATITRLQVKGPAKKPAFPTPGFS
jgi:hypothetical protein